MASRAADTGTEDPPTDPDGLTYSADLLTLAGIGPADGPTTPPLPVDPHSATPNGAAPDPEESR